MKELFTLLTLFKLNFEVKFVTLRNILIFCFFVGSLRDF